MVNASLTREQRIAEAKRGFVRRSLQHRDVLSRILAAPRLDRGRLGELAHRLRGTGGSYGFAMLSDRAAEVEENLRRNVGDDEVRNAVSLLVDVLSDMQAGSE